jgi:hypothetical protein
MTDLHTLVRNTPRWLRTFSWDGSWTSTPSDATTRSTRSSDGSWTSTPSSDDESDETEWLDDEVLLSSMSLMAKCFGIWKLCTNNNVSDLYRKQKLARRRLAYLLT